MYHDYRGYYLLISVVSSIAILYLIVAKSLYTERSQGNFPGILVEHVSTMVPGSREDTLRRVQLSSLLGLHDVSERDVLSGRTCSSGCGFYLVETTLCRTDA